MNVLHNISRGVDFNITLTNKKIKDLLVYHQFNIHNSQDPTISFRKKVLLQISIKCINWFEYRYNEYLAFHVLKAKNISTNKTYFFFFKYFYNKIYTKEEIDKNKDLSLLYELSKLESNIYDILSYDIKDGKEIKINHFDHCINFEQTILQFDQHINKENKKQDFVILQTNFRQFFPTLCDNMFDDFRFFSILNNFLSSGSYNVEGSFYKHDKFDNVFFIDNKNIQLFFKNYFIEKEEISRNCLAFDIESDITTELINSHLNIISHIGLEYFHTKNKNQKESFTKEQFHSFKNETIYPKVKTLKDDNLFEISFNTCLINLDLHLKKSIVKNKQNKETENRLIYNYLKNISGYENVNIDNYKSIIQSEIENLKKNKQVLFLKKNKLVEKSEFINLLLKIKKKNIKFVFCKEIQMIQFFLKLLECVDIDYILTYNGNKYDFPQLGKRYSFLMGTEIISELYLPSLYGEDKIVYKESKNPHTNFNIKNLILHSTPYFSIDIFNYIKKFYDRFSSYSLKDIAQEIYNSKCFIIKQNLKPNTYIVHLLKIEKLKQLKQFLIVFLTSNFCYIDSKSYKIIEKDQEFKNDIYKTDIDKIINNVQMEVDIDGQEYYFLKSKFIIFSNTELVPSEFSFKNYKKNMFNIALSKDDVEISSSKMVDQFSSLDIALYCIHDTHLCRYLFVDYFIQENIDIFSKIYILPQRSSLNYRNTTNVKGQLLQTCLNQKSIFIETKKLTISTYSGGLVLEPKNLFLKEPVIVLDFLSLYPKIMMKYNLSPDTLCMVIILLSEIHFEIIKKFISKKISYDDYSVIYIIENNEYKICIFKKTPKGILSSVLINLLTLRQHYKKEAKKFLESNQEYLYQNANLLQTALKVIANSIYGSIGSEYSRFCCKFTSQCITSVGAQLLTFLSQYLDNSVLYNNSISIYNPKFSSKYEKYRLEKDKVFNLAIEKYIPIKQTFPIKFNYNQKIILDIIYGDTDSIMVCLKGINFISNLHLKSDKEYTSEVIKIVSQIGTEINNMINEKILQKLGLELEFENIYINMIIQSKKKYLALNADPFQTSDQLSRILKGISLKRRDICEYHKKIIRRVYQFIDDILIEKRFQKETNISIYDFKNPISYFFEKIIKECISDYVNNKLKIEDFLISSSFKKNYKNENYHVLKLVNTYNLDANEQISTGDRFYYIYLKEYDHTKSIIEDFNWGNGQTTTNKFKIIFSESLDINKYRLVLEVYIHKIQSDISSIFNKEKIISSSLDQIYKRIFPKKIN